jgi:Skp family chaperone for outer membrane proteins
MRYAALLAFVTVAGAATGHAADVEPVRPLHLCVLDQSAILQRSRLAVNMASRFQQIRQQTQQKFQDDSRTLDADASAVESLRSVLPPVVAKAKADSIAQRRLQLKARGDQINRQLAELDSDLTREVAKISEPTIRLIESERGCSLLIASGTLLHLDDASLDITPAVIDQMNGAF